MACIVKAQRFFTPGRINQTNKQLILLLFKSHNYQFSAF